MSLPVGWVETSVGECSDAIQYGLTCTSSSQGTGHRYIRITDIQDRQIDWATVPFADIDSRKASACEVAKGDLLFARTGATVGKSYLIDNVPEPAAFASYLIRVRCNPEAVLPEFAAWYFQSPSYWEQIYEGAEGTGQPNFNGSKLSALEFALPPLAEQRRIVAKLDALTARLARARAELDRVPVLAKRGQVALLRSAVSGEMTATWRENAPKRVSVLEALEKIPAPEQGRGGREATDKIIPGTGGLSVNNPGTDLPKGWAWVPLLRLAKQETGHTPSRSHPEYWDGGVPWIGIRDAGAHHGGYVDSTAQTISELGLANSSARLLPAGTVCLSRTASVGYVTIMAREMATSQDFATWTCTSALLPEYLMYILMAEGENIRKFGMGSTHTTIYFPEVRAFHIALPPVAEQQEIVDRIKSAITRADRLEAEAARARALLDRLEAAILARAFRGELVPQDPADEPASILLARIRQSRAAAPTAKRGRKAKAA